jgi:hypothetical protein
MSSVSVLCQKIDIAISKFYCIAGVNMMEDRWTGHMPNNDDIAQLVTHQNIAASFVIKNIGLPHRAVSTHMQRTCYVCKHLGRRIQSQTAGFDNRIRRICRSSYKCESCDISLCIGDRMCFQQFHEMLRTTRYPSLVWENPHRSVLLPQPLL